MNSRKLSPCIVRVVLLFVVTVICGEPIFGQAAARPNRGTMPTGSYAVSDLETISLTNGNLNIGIPLASLPPVAGGKLGLTLRAVYNSKLWDTVRRERQFDPVDPATKYVVSNLQLSGNGGWLIGGGYSISFVDAWDDYEWLNPSQTDPEYDLITQNRWTKVVLTTPDGATHELRPVDYFSYADGWAQHNHLRGYYKDNPNKVNGPVRYYSFDGSHLWAKIDPNPFADPSNPSMGRLYGVAQSWTLYLPDGTKVEQMLNGVQRITDTNGNKIKIFASEETPGVFIQHYQDEQTGRDIRITYDPAGNSGQGVNYVKYQTVGGSWETIAINYGSTHVFGKRYEFGDLECADAADYVDTEMTVIRSIVYPPTEPGQPGRQFTFTYNSDTTDTVNYQWRPNCWVPYETVAAASHGWGSLSQITMPSGAIVNYGHGLDGRHYLHFNPDDAPREGVGLKTVTHDGTSETWTYGVNPAAGGFTAPDGSAVTEWRYSSDPGFAHTYSGFGGKEELVYRTNNSNKVMVERHWTLMKFTGGESIAPGGNVQVAFNPVVDAEYTSLLDDTPSHNPVKMSAKTYQHDFNGNVIQTTEYDWFDPGLVSRDAQGVPTGVPAGATVIRVTNNSYHHPATTSSSGNVYAKRSLSTATPRILNALQETSTGPAITQLSYDGQAYSTPPTAGNLTSQSVWDNVDNKWITSSQTYGPFGNLESKTDARGKVTEFFFDDATHALPTRVIVDPQNGTSPQESLTTYDYSTGLPTSRTDPNGKTTNISYVNQLLPPNTVDPFGRPGIVTDPLGQQTRTLYQDSSRTVTVMSDLHSAGDGLLKSQVLSDQLGRTIETRQFETAANFIAVRKSYDTPNRISKTSNPFRAGETIQWTTTVSDLLGRVVSVTTPDNAVVSTVYNSNSVTVTDQAGKARRSVTDALGRLIQIYEDPSGLNYLTSYDYDVFGNLLHVYQHSQTRTFTYDSLSRLRTAFNPESGEVNYTYDDNGNLTRKTDARGIHIDYAYDALNRNTSADYSNTTIGNPNIPDITRIYDTATNGKGRLRESYAGGNETVGSNVEHIKIQGYDALGRPLDQRQRFKTGGVWSGEYKTERTYNLRGLVATQEYPSSNKVSFNYDNAGRLADKDAQNSAFSGNLGGSQRTYSKGLSYSPFGSMTREQFGTDIPLYHKRHLNVRGQQYDVRLSTINDDQDWNRGAIVLYYSSINGYVGGASGPDNNGNVLRAQTWIPLEEDLDPWVNFDDWFVYDSLNRITSITEYPNNGSVPVLAQAYTYDRYGNRRINANPAVTYGGVNNLAFDMPSESPDNRLYAPGDLALAEDLRQMQYDAAGNLKKDTYTGAGDRVYDAENRMTKGWGGNNQWQEYTYNADGQRVRRKVDGTEMWQIYGMDGELLAEYVAGTPAPSPQKEYGYRNGELLITAEAPPGASAVNVAPSPNGGVALAFTPLASASGQFRELLAMNAGTEYVAEGNPQTEKAVSDSTFSPFSRTPPRARDNAGIVAPPEPQGNGYTHRRDISIDHTKVPNTQSNFPVLISGTYGYLKTVANNGDVQNANGYDIIFTSDSGCTTKLNHEVETYNAATGAVNYWVNVPTVLHTTDTVIYLCYGNSGITTDQSNKTAVWNGNYQGVWHLPNGSTLSAADSTANGNNGTSHGATATAGKVGGAAGLNGVSAYLSAASSSSLNVTGDLTYEIWWKAPSSLGSSNYTFGAKYDGTTQPYNFFYDPVQDKLGFYASTTGVFSSSAAGVTSSSWHHLAWTISGTTLTFYVNGVAKGTAAVGGRSGSTGAFTIGQTASVNWVKDAVDEARLSNASRNADWIKATYNNQSSPATFYSIFAPSGGGYAHRRDISIDHTKVPNTQSNFPVLISGTYGYLKTVANNGDVQNANGYDIIFTSDSGCTTKLNHEVETYNAATGAVNYWVNVPTVLHTTDTVIYLCYGNSGITTDQSNKTAVWNGNYQGVWHMPNGSTLSAADSTANGNNGTSHGSTATAGKIDGAAGLNGVSAYLSAASSSSLNVTGDLTYEIWWKTPSSLGASNYTFGAKYDGVTQPYNFFYDPVQDKLGFYASTTGSFSSSAAGVTSGSWHHLAWTISGTTLTFYVNGVAKGTAAVGGRSGSTGAFTIGQTASVNWVKDAVDEARLSNASRSSDWVATQYNNQSSPSTFYTVSAESGGGNEGADIRWIVTDHLGTPRIIVDKSGALANVKRHDYLPFGEELLAGTGSRTAPLGYSGDNVRQKFTLKERDNETGLDYFLARYYSSTQGRFTSPDDFLNDTHVDDPASWNLYAYVRNNPLRYVDPAGEEVYSTNLTDEEKKKLIEDWQKKTGYQSISFDKNNKLVIDAKAGFQGGSAKARDQLSAAVNSTDIRFNLKAVDTTKVAFAEVDGGTTVQNYQTKATRTDYTVSIDFQDFKRAGGDDAAKEAFSVGLVAIHEFDHRIYNASDNPNSATDPGPLERTYINPIRQELGLAQRVHYASRPVDAALRNFYPGGGQQINFKLNGKDKVIRWRNDLVGGKIKD